MDIQDRVIDALKKCGRTQKELGNCISVSASTLNSWLKQKRDIPSQYILPIADFLGVTVIYLLTGQDEEPYVQKEEMPKLFGVKGNQIAPDLSEEELKALKLLTNEAVTKRMQEIARQVYKEETESKENGET